MLRYFIVFFIAFFVFVGLLLFFNIIPFVVLYANFFCWAACQNVVALSQLDELCRRFLIKVLFHSCNALFAVNLLFKLLPAKVRIKSELCKKTAKKTDTTTVLSAYCVLPL